MKILVATSLLLLLTSIEGFSFVLSGGHDKDINIGLDSVQYSPLDSLKKLGCNPINISGAPYWYNEIIAENLVEYNGKYWVIVTDRGRNPWVISLLSSSDLVNWKYEKILLSDQIINDPGREFDAPCIVHGNNAWYIFYGSYKGSINSCYPIGIAKSRSDNILGPYTEINKRLLNPGRNGSWEQSRVTEPYAIQLDNGKWNLLYMGDSGNFTEQVGLATSDSSIEGPYVKNSANPILSFGNKNQLDGGTVSDPWAIKIDTTYYIGYSASDSKTKWDITYAVTNDWVNFKKSDRLILNKSGSASFDDTAAWRGAVTKIKDFYVLTYTGRSKNGDEFGIAYSQSYNLNNACSESGNSIITNINLYQNYPNPFNPATILSFDLNSFQSDISLNIYDLNGRLVNGLFRGSLKSGKYKFTFNPKNLSSGVYFYKLQSDNYSITKKMIYIK